MQRQHNNANIPPADLVSLQLINSTPRASMIEQFLHEIPRHTQHSLERALTIHCLVVLRHLITSELLYAAPRAQLAIELVRCIESEECRR